MNNETTRLEIVAGPGVGRTVAIPSRQLIRVGRGANAEVSIPEDQRLSTLHFSIEGQGSTYEIRDLDSTLGTFVNSRSVGHTALSDGDEIKAGQSIFLFQSTTPEAQLTQLYSGDDLCDILFRQAQPIYALLDAARDRLVLRVLEQSGEQYLSLYEGKQGQDLGDYAPYIVRVYENSPLIDPLIEHGWGRSWGVFLRCELSLLEIRRHLRHFLFVRNPEGDEHYFRFYDPRVLRVFLPTCTDEQRKEFFGPVDLFLAEADCDNRLVKFMRSGDRFDKEIRIPQFRVGGDW